jgi:hypothetical protein
MDPMSVKIHRGIVAFVAVAGLASAALCQSHMVAEATAAPSHHANSETGAHSRHGHADSSHGEDGREHEPDGAPEDLCCLIHAGEVRLAERASISPTLVGIVTRPGFEAPTVASPPCGRSLTHKPPGALTPLQRTCTLLI